MDTILTQVKQLSNNYVTKNINTGDKITDVAISVMILALFDIVVKYATTYFTTLISSVKTGKNPWDFDPTLVPKITDDDLKKFKYSLSLSNACDAELRVNGAERSLYDYVHNWITERFGNCTVRENTVRCEVISNDGEPRTFLGGSTITSNNFGNLSINVYNTDKQNVFMPIWSYKLHSKQSYIYIANNTLYSDSKSELQKLLAEIGSLNKEQHVKIAQSRPTRPSKQLEILELKEVWSTDKKAYTSSYERVGYVNKNKTFDKIFFDEKEKLLIMLEKYKNKTIYPSSLGLDNKLGILLYGPPGTGKTGTVFCVANMLQKPILLINSLKVKKTTIISAVNDVKKTHIIVLDEFDHLLDELKSDDLNDITGGFFSDTCPITHCGPSQPIQSAKKPSSKSSKSANSSNSLTTTSTSEPDDDELENLDENEKKKIIATKKAMQKFTDLPNDVFMYKLLDSFGDDEDRIIIATTNSPDLVNPVLLRPGRFDMKLCLSYCSLNMFINIAQKVYDINTYMTNTDNANKITEILRLNVTPLVLINTLILSTSLDDCIDRLSKQKQKYYEKEPVDE